MPKDLTETTPPMSPDHQALEELAKEAETPEDQAYLRDELRIINDDRDETGIPPVSVDDLPPVEDSDTREPIQDPRALHVDASGVVMTVVVETGEVT